MRIGDKVHFTLEQEWKPNSLASDLKIEGDCCTVWRVSQLAIGDLLFNAL